MKIVEQSAFSVAENKVEDCQCLPSCTDFEFPALTSFSKITAADMLLLPGKIKETQPHLSNSSFVTDNVAVLHVYFR